MTIFFCLQWVATDIAGRDNDEVIWSGCLIPGDVGVLTLRRREQRKKINKISQLSRRCCAYLNQSRGGD